MKRLIILIFLIALLPFVVYGQTPTPTDTPVPTDTPTSTPTNTPTNTPTVPSTPIYADRMTDNWGFDVEIMAVDKLNLGFDAGSNDTYTATVPDVNVEHGTVLTIFVNTANTGACTLNVNSGGALPIKTSGGDDPANDYMEADSFIQVVYNAQKGWYQLLSPDANP